MATETTVAEVGRAGRIFSGGPLDGAGLFDDNFTLFGNSKKREKNHHAISTKHQGTSMQNSPMA